MHLRSAIWLTDFLCQCVNVKNLAFGGSKMFTRSDT